MVARPHGDRRAIARQWQASSPDELVAGKPAHQPLQFQNAERGQDLRGSQALRAISSSTPTGWLPSWPSNDRSWSLRQSSAGWWTGGLVRGGVDLANQRAKLLKDILDRLDQAGIVTDQAVAAAAGQAVHRAGHGEDLPVLLHGVVRGGQRPAPRRGLDDHDAQTKARNDAVALGEPVWVAIGCG